MKRIFPANVIESSIRLVGIDTFMGFVYNQNVPRQTYFFPSFTSSLHSASFSYWPPK